MKPTPTISLGIHPTELINSVTSDARLELVNESEHAFSDIKLTVSYFDADGKYLDFEDMELETIIAGDHQVTELDLSPPEHTITATIDISAQKQTFLKRHWVLISMVAAISWGLIIVARRLAP